MTFNDILAILKRGRNKYPNRNPRKSWVGIVVHDGMTPRDWIIARYWMAKE